MPSARSLALPALLLFLAGCDDRALRQRVDEIRQRSNKEDRAYTAEAIQHIERNYWSVRGHTWIGKCADGRIFRIEAPHAEAAPLPSRAFYSGWHLQLTISSEDCRTYPGGAHDGAFETVYAITRHSATSWDIRVTDGTVTSPLQREDAVRIEGEQ